MTLPTNYVSFNALQGYYRDNRGRQNPCGPSRDSVLLPVTGPFHSNGFQDREDYSFNFADLATGLCPFSLYMLKLLTFFPVPVDAWTKQRQCGQGHTGCRDSPIIQTEYTPILPMPTGVLDIEPEAWKGRCTGGGFYFHYSALATPALTATARLLMD